MKWEETLLNTDQARLELYKTIKRKFGYENYLAMSKFEIRKCIAKIRCSNHTRYQYNIKPRNERICKVCNLRLTQKNIFSLNVPGIKNWRKKYDLTQVANNNYLLTMYSPELRGQFITDLYKIRTTAMNWQAGQERPTLDTEIWLYFYIYFLYIFCEIP